MPRLEQAEADAWIHMFPRRKADGVGVPASTRRAPVRFDLADLEALFELPQPDAARKLGISLTALKQACRKLGVQRWPYQRQTALQWRDEAASGDDEHALEHAGSSQSAASACPTETASPSEWPCSPTTDDDLDACSIPFPEILYLSGPAVAVIAHASSIASPEERIHVASEGRWQCLAVWLTEPTGEQIVYDDEEFDAVIASLP